MVVVKERGGAAELGAEESTAVVLVGEPGEGGGGRSSDLSLARQAPTDTTSTMEEIASVAQIAFDRTGLPTAARRNLMQRPR